VLSQAVSAGNSGWGIVNRGQEEVENGAPLIQGRSIVIVLAGYSVMSMVINEEAEPGHSISLGVGV
jgi:hypothetical protein